jgi:hypothetical protein
MNSPRTPLSELDRNRRLESFWSHFGVTVRKGNLGEELELQTYMAIPNCAIHHPLEVVHQSETKGAMCS